MKDCCDNCKEGKECCSVHEGGMGILTSDQADVLQGIVMRNKNKSLKAILNVAVKSGYFKNVDKKELLGYIDGAKQFVKYMKSHPMESINEKMGPEQYHTYMQYVFDTQFKTPDEKKMKKSIIKKINVGQKKKGLPLFKESDLGYTYKKGKTVKVKHKKSGKELVIVDKPAVRKKYEKLGFIAERKKRDANNLTNEFSKSFKKFTVAVNGLAKSMYNITGNRTDQKIVMKAFKKHIIPFVQLVDSWNRGQQKNPHLSESINEAIKPQGYSQLNTMAKHAGIYIRDLLKALRKQDDNAVIREVHFLAAQFTTMEKMLKDKKWNAKYSESVNEAGMGILTTDQSDVLQGIVLRNKNKNLKAILKIVLKDPMFKGVDKKELLGYIDGARQFVKYMKSHPMESVNEDRDYKAEYKKYGSSTKAKKYRAELNQYNRKKGTYGNNDGKDASHKGGKIVGFEKESTNRGRREKSRLKKEDIREDIGLDVYLGGIIKAMRKSRLKPKTAKVMKHGFSKSKDKIGFFIDVEKREIEGKKLWTLQFEVDRDGYLWYLSAPRDIKIGKWADTSQLVRGFKKLDRLPGFGQDAIFKRRR